ncbi:hypothetical protein HHK36_012525 [Tetracentron sinense]|uniref:RRM domain-containing protein n=1 Tax=Tetracentron sinense TaxID=13715 RepID=A0A834Z8X8_TETSI|nr:hypothetical protein HHK36_012525 [Tetracentron sinense]
MGRYRSRSRSYSPRRSRSPLRRKRYDDPRDRYQGSRPEDLRIPFERFGPVKDVEPRGFGFVKFRNAEDAAEAKQQMNHTVIGGREITIVYAEENRKTPQEMRTTSPHTSFVPLAAADYVLDLSVVADTEEAIEDELLGLQDVDIVLIRARLHQPGMIQVKKELRAYKCQKKEIVISREWKPIEVLTARGRGVFLMELSSFSPKKREVGNLERGGKERVVKLDRDRGAKDDYYSLSRSRSISHSRSPHNEREYRSNRKLPNPRENDGTDRRSPSPRGNGRSPSRSRSRSYSCTYSNLMMKGIVAIKRSSQVICWEMINHRPNVAIDFAELG